MPTISSTEPSYDVAVIGGGIVGASFAAALATTPEFADRSIALIDAGPEPKIHQGADFDPRVVALTRNSQQFFSALGLWPQLQSRACPYRRMVVWDGEGTAEIEFNSADLPRDQPHQDLGHIVENSAIVRSLLEQIEQTPNVVVRRGDKLAGMTRHLPEDEGQSAWSQLRFESGQRLNAQLVVAADGANSKVRELLNIPTREWDYGHTAIVTTVRAKKPHQHTAWQRFAHSGPLAFLPLPEIDGEQGYCSIVWSVDSQQAPALLALEDGEFARVLAAAFEQRLGPIYEVARRHSFPLRQRHAVRYVEPGVALLGDAAHTIHPLAGQGVNLGLLDVQALLTELRRAISRSLPMSHVSVLQRYQRQRMGENLAVMGLMEAFKRLFASRHPALHVARNWGINQLQQLKPVKAAIARRAMGL